MNALVLRLEVVNLNIKQTRGMLRQYVDNKVVKRGSTGSGHMSLNGEPIPLRSSNTQSPDKKKGGGGSGDTSNVAYTIFQTADLGTSPLTISCKAFGKKGGTY